MKEVLFFLMFVLIYFLPTLIAIGKKYVSGIFTLNLLLGWTILGWIGALIWAVSSPNKK